MSSFYVSMIFLGIVLILISLAWVAFEKRSSFSFMKKMDEKKQDMVTIINDAEQMIEELNRFSDYIVTQMDVKNEEMQSSLKRADSEIQLLHAAIERAMAVNSGKAAAGSGKKAEKPAAVQTETKQVLRPEVCQDTKAESMTEDSGKLGVSRVVNGSTEKLRLSAEPVHRYGSDLIVDSLNLERTSTREYRNQHIQQKRSEKVIPINSKHNEVLRLSANGLGETEIAKMLNMGKGEIQLILELNK